MLPDHSQLRMREWGSRMWTFTEAILSSHRELLFYDGTQMRYFTKTDLPGVTWEDGEVSRMLAEHYTGTLILSSLELTVAALTALRHRRSNT